MEVKQEPPEEFLVFLPSPDSVESEPEEEEDIDPNCTQFNVKEESPWDDVVTRTTTTGDQSLSTTNPIQQYANKFRCPKCGQQFKSHSGLRHHGNSKIIFKCAVCDAEFSCRLLRDRHQSEFHEALLKCDKCSYQTENAKYFVTHKRREHDKKMSCETCEKKFAVNHSLNVHQMQYKHGIYATAPDVTFNCNECDKTFSNAHNLRAHQSRVHAENEVKCDVCDKVCKNQLTMRTHNQTHVKVKCSICNETITKRSMPRHLLTHSGVRSFQCGLCSYSSKTKGGLKSHIEAMHLKKKLVNDSFALPDPDDCLLVPLLAPKEQSQQARTQRTKKQSAGGRFKKDLLKHSRSKAIHKRATCDTKFSSELSQDRHQSKLHGTVFECDKCSYRTKIKDTMKGHQGMHVKSISCETCQKKFSVSNSLKHHQMQHRHGFYVTAPVVTFGCENCDKSFSNPSYLKQHQKQIHDENEVKCEVCGKICDSQLKLRMHCQTHDKVECSICRKKVAKRTMPHHLRTHSADYLFECDLCKYSVKIKDCLKRHIERMHLKKKLVSESKYRECATNFEFPNLSSVNIKKEPLTQAEVKVEPKI